MSTLLIFPLIFLCTNAFAPPLIPQCLTASKQTTLHLSSSRSRRQFAKTLLLPLLAPLPSNAEESDLTSSLYNSDGSLRDELKNTVEAQYRLISIPLPPSFKRIEIVDSNLSQTNSPVCATYKLPLKWRDGYIDTNLDTKQDFKATTKISILKPPGDGFTLESLSKASTRGIEKSLGLEPGYLGKPDIIGGKRDEDYFRFDLAVAPLECSSSADNLGLGFCPYNKIVLLNSVVVDGGMYVFALECDREQWKRGNSDLKRVRDSFQVVTEG